MSRTTKLMGTACVLAASFVAGPAAADTLAGFSAMVNVDYTRTSVTKGGSGDVNSIGVGGAIAMPVDAISGLNWQLDAQYNRLYARCSDDKYCKVWDLGFSPFWAGQSGRVGFNINYKTETNLGHLTNGGLFTEWYFGPLTAAAKGGFLSTGGTEVGGHGNYVGGAVTFYALPNLSITGAVDWSDLLTGHGCVTCGRTDLHNTYYTALVEFLISEQFPVSIYGAFSYGQHTDSLFHDRFNTTTFFVGAHYYVGRGMPLIDQHRNGNLFPWLRGSGFEGPLPE